jgi:hypothetical protein
MSMTSKLKDLEKAATTMAKKAERLHDAALPAQDYRSQALASQANTERLRTLRLAKERTECEEPNANKRA